MFLLDSGLWGIRKETWKQKWKEWSPYLARRRELYILSDNMLQRISRSNQTPYLSSPSQWWQLQINAREVSGIKRWHIGLETNINKEVWKTRNIERMVPSSGLKKCGICLSPGISRKRECIEDTRMKLKLTEGCFHTLVCTNSVYWELPLSCLYMSRHSKIAYKAPLQGQLASQT